MVELLGSSGIRLQLLLPQLLLNILQHNVPLAATETPAVRPPPPTCSTCHEQQPFQKHTLSTF